MTKIELMELDYKIARLQDHIQKLESENDRLTKALEEAKAGLEYYDQVHRLNWTINFNDLPKVAANALAKIDEVLK